MSELTRANKVTINASNDGFKADFYRTHKHLCTVNSADTEFKPTEGMTKSGIRELFRAYVIEHAEDYGIDWNPTDMRTADNIRKASYTTDDELVEDATSMIIKQMKPLAESCKYPIEWGGITFDDIVPMTETAKGTPLNTMGIIDGKYEKSGNWAWADILFTLTVKYNKNEVYMTVRMELVSGQLKKPKMGIMAFNEAIKTEIIESGLATAEELDPPKESKKPKAEKLPEEATSNVVVESAADEVHEEQKSEEKPKRRTRAKKNEAAK